MAKATITSKGQITIPKEIRDFLQVDTSDSLEFSILDYESKTVQVKKANKMIPCPLCKGTGSFAKYVMPCFLCDQTGEIENRSSSIEILFRCNLRKYMISVNTIGQDCGVPQIILNSKNYPRALLDEVQDFFVMKFIEENAPRSISNPAKFMIPSDTIIEDYLNLLTTKEAKEALFGWFRGERTI